MKATVTKVRVLKPKLALGQKLKAFNAAKQGGEVGISGLVGAEVFGKGFDQVAKAGNTPLNPMRHSSHHPSSNPHQPFNRRWQLNRPRSLRLLGMPHLIRLHLRHDCA